MALPNSAICHFRYKEKWVDAEIRDKLDEEKQKTRNQEEYLERLRKLYYGQPALFVFVDQPRNREERTEENIRFFPLRHCVIEHLEPAGSVIHIYFRLGHFVNWRKSNSGEFDKTITEEFDKSVREHLSKDKRPVDIFLSVKDRHLPSQIGITETDAQDLAWESAVDAISSIETFRQTIFLRLAGVTKTSPNSLPVRLVSRILRPRVESTHRYEATPLAHVLPDRPGYILKANSIYYLELVFYHPDEKDSNLEVNTIKPLIDETLFVNAPSEIDVNFRYDRHRVLLAPKQTNEDILTRITLGLKNKMQTQGNDPDHLRSPDIYLLLKLSYARVPVVFTFMALILAQLLTAAGTILISVKDEPFLDLGRTFSLLGPLLTAIVLFVMLKKLPGGK